MAKSELKAVAEATPKRQQPSEQRQRDMLDAAAQISDLMTCGREGDCDVEMLAYLIRCDALACAVLAVFNDDIPDEEFHAIVRYGRRC